MMSQEGKLSRRFVPMSLLLLAFKGSHEEGGVRGGGMACEGGAVGLSSGMLLILAVQAGRNTMCVGSWGLWGENKMGFCGVIQIILKWDGAEIFILLYAE